MSTFRSWLSIQPYGTNRPHVRLLKVGYCQRPLAARRADFFNDSAHFGEIYRKCFNWNVFLRVRLIKQIAHMYPLFKVTGQKRTRMPTSIHVFYKIFAFFFYLHFIFPLLSLIASFSSAVGLTALPRSHGPVAASAGRLERLPHICSFRLRVSSDCFNRHIQE